MHIATYRRITQIGFILIVFLMPVLDILRYDTATKELFIFGQVWGLGLKEGFYADQSMGGAGRIALQFFLRAILPWLVVLSVFPLLGFLTGRLFCGWLCPEGTLFELSDWLTVKVLGRRSLFTGRQNDPDSDGRHRGWYVLLALAAAVTIPLLGGIALTGYFIAPKTVWAEVLSGKFSFGVRAGIIGVSAYMLITSILVRHNLCKFVCAAGLMQMLFGWVSPVSFRVRIDASRAAECTNCRKCDKACFMNVVPRANKRDISCVNCGECIAACRRELGPGKGLFSFSSGLAEAGKLQADGQRSGKPVSVCKS